MKEKVESLQSFAVPPGVLFLEQRLLFRRGTAGDGMR